MVTLGKDQKSGEETEHDEASNSDDCKTSGVNLLIMLSGSISVLMLVVFGFVGVLEDHEDPDLMPTPAKTKIRRRKRPGVTDARTSPLDTSRGASRGRKSPSSGAGQSRSGMLYYTIQCMC